MEETIPYYDILGIESHADVESAYQRLEVYYDRHDELESGEFADIVSAYEALKKGPVPTAEIDRSVWQWETLKDKNGEWNTLVRKAHKATRKEQRKKEWDTDKAKTSKRQQERGRQQDRGRRTGGGGRDNDD